VNQAPKPLTREKRRKSYADPGGALGMCLSGVRNILDPEFEFKGRMRHRLDRRPTSMR
jgi:hypothetical protein